MIPVTLLWFATSSLLACLGAVVIGQLQPWLAALSLALGLAVAATAWLRGHLPAEKMRLSLPVALVYLVILVGFFFHSTLLFYKKDDFFWILNPFNLGDLSFHFGSIRNLANGAHFWPENPIYLGHRFKYPFGMDFFNSLWESLGVPLSAHLPLVTLLGLIVTLLAAHFAGGPFLVLAIFFSAGYYNFISPPTWDLVRVQEPLAFKNLFLTVLMTQRGFLYALPAGLYVFKCLQKHFAGQWRPEIFEKILLGVMWGGLGFFHLHSYFFLSLYFGLWILWKKEFRTWWPTVIVAVILGMPFVINALIPEPGTNPLVHWSRGWTMTEADNALLYWLKNMGPWILAVTLALGLTFQAKRWSEFIPTCFVFLLFILFGHLILAPWEWDNIKLLLWCYVLGWLNVLPILWEERSPRMKVLFAALCFFPGAILFIRSLPLGGNGVTWVSERELNKSVALLRGVDVNEGLAIAPEYQHPALLLGYKLYMGYPGHVWSHGYDYGPREEWLKNLYNNAPGVLQSDLRQGLHLIYLGPLERQRYVSPQLPAEAVKLGEALDHALFRIK